MNRRINRFRNFLAAKLPIAKYKYRIKFNRKKGFRYIGNNVTIGPKVDIVHRERLSIGHNVRIQKGCFIDATYGVMIGDNVDVAKETTISSQGIYEKGAVIIGAGNTVSGRLGPGTFLANRYDIDNSGGNRLFVVSTGRSGSNAIVTIFNQLKDVECYHEGFPQIYPVVVDKLYKSKSSSETIDGLKQIFNSTLFTESRLEVHSDQKLAAVIPELADIFPKAKFLWILRDAKGFVSSSYPRGWFSNSEFGLVPNPEQEFFRKRVIPDQFHADYRIDGVKAGEFTSGQWNGMSAFERNCWYWNFWNSMTERNLRNISSSRWMRIDLKEMNHKLPELLAFVGIESSDLKPRNSNSAYYQKLEESDWTEEMMAILEHWCGSNCRRWFDQK